MTYTDAHTIVIGQWIDHVLLIQKMAVQGSLPRAAAADEAELLAEGMQKYLEIYSVRREHQEELDLAHENTPLK